MCLHALNHIEIKFCDSYLSFGFRYIKLQCCIQRNLFDSYEGLDIADAFTTG